jgi:hypothetical protein
MLSFMKKWDLNISKSAINASKLKEKGKVSKNVVTVLRQNQYQIKLMNK